MMAEGGGEELQGALVTGVEKDAAGWREVGGKVGGALARMGGPSRSSKGSGVPGDWIGDSRDGGCGEAGGMGRDEGADGVRFFGREDDTVVTAGGAAGGEVTGPEEGVESGVIEARFAELGAEEEAGGEEGGARLGHEAA
jgi:hypothetical protein